MWSTKKLYNFSGVKKIKRKKEEEWESDKEVNHFPLFN